MGQVYRKEKLLSFSWQNKISNNLQELNTCIMKDNNPNQHFGYLLFVVLAHINLFIISMNFMYKIIPPCSFPFKQDLNLFFLFTQQQSSLIHQWCSSTQGRMKGEAIEQGETSRAPMARGINRGTSILDLILRLLALIGTLGSAIAMGTTNETLPFFTQFIQFKAEYNDLPTFT